jgi:hypothetical protein
MLLGLAVVSAGLPRYGRLASATMAAAIVALPATMIADWRRRGTAPAKRRPAARRKSRRPAKRPAKSKRR